MDVDRSSVRLMNYALFAGLLSANALAKALHVPALRINDVVRERRGVTADTALRLARYFGGDAQSWLNLQSMYELRVAQIANAKKINREVEVRTE